MLVLSHVCSYPSASEWRLASAVLYGTAPLGDARLAVGMPVGHSATDWAPVLIAYCEPTRSEFQFARSFNAALSRRFVR